MGDLVQREHIVVHYSPVVNYNVLPVYPRSRTERVHCSSLQDCSELQCALSVLDLG